MVVLTSMQRVRKTLYHVHEFTAIFKLLFKIAAIGRYTRFQWEHTLAQVDKETEYLLQDVG